MGNLTGIIAIGLIVMMALAPAVSAQTSAIATSQSQPAGGKVVTQDGTKIVQGVPILAWGMNKDCTFAGALEAAIAPTSQPCSYVQIMGDTGLSFRTRWFQGKGEDRWCPSSPVGEFPEEVERAQKSCGWTLRAVARMDQKEPSMEDQAGAIKASIDEGLPVMAYTSRMDLGVIFGYQTDGKLLARDYSKGREALVVEPAKLGPMVMYLDKRVSPAPRKEAVHMGLDAAVKNWSRGGAALVSEKGEYLHGKAAIEAWAKDLQSTKDLSDKQRESLFFVSWWCFSSMLDARASGLAWLKYAAKDAGADAVKELDLAAESYTQEVKLLRETADKKDAFLGPWSGKTIKDWAPEVQQREADILKQCLELETAAQAHMAKALASMK